MLARIIIVSVILQGVTSNRRIPDVYQGTILQQSQQQNPQQRHHAPWRNIWTTLSPPTSPKPKKLSVYDTIRATAAASKRINGDDPYQQQIVSPGLYKPKAIFPTRKTGRFSPSAVSARMTSTFRASKNSAKPYENTKVNPTAETFFSAHRSVGGLQDRGTSQVLTKSEINARGNTNRVRSSSMAQRAHSVGGTGLHEEASMFDTGSLSPEPSPASHFDIFATKPKNAIALYSYDHRHDHGHAPGTSTTSGKHVRTSTIMEKKLPKTQSLYKILPDGSIVNYGISGGRFRTTSPMTGTTKENVKSSAVNSQKVQPTSASSELSSPGYRASSTSSKEHPRAKPASTTHRELALPVVPPVSPTRSSVQPLWYTGRSGLDAHGGLIVDDSLSFVVDDPLRRKDDRYVLNSSQRKETGALNYLAQRSDHLSLEPTFTTRKKTWTTFQPASTTRRKTTTSPTTTTSSTTTTTPTTTTSTTTTSTTTTTTPKPKPIDDYWTKQGGSKHFHFFKGGKRTEPYLNIQDGGTTLKVPINITYVNDNHVCPKSRARWQDYTVYLETKPRLCMIRITFNARYKREPIYHNSWWGQNVEWIYRTVYDPDVRIVDLHGWRGSTWYG